MNTVKLSISRALRKVRTGQPAPLAIRISWGSGKHIYYEVLSQDAFNERILLTKEQFEKMMSARPGDYRKARETAQAVEIKMRNIIKEMSVFNIDELLAQVEGNQSTGIFADFQRYADTREKYKTAKKVETSMKAIQAYAPDLTYGMINKEWIQMFIKDMVEGNGRSAVAPSTAKGYVSYLKAVYNHSIDIEKIPMKNPFRGVSLQSAVNVKKQVLDIHQFIQLTEYNAPTYDEQRYIHMFIFSILCNGILMSDILDLRMEDVDYERGLIYLGRRTKVANTQGGSLMNRVDLTPMLKDMIDRYNPNPNPQDPVFDVMYKSNAPYEQRIDYVSKLATKAVRKACRALEIPVVTFKNARETFAYLAIEEGNVDVSELSRLLQHSSLAVTKHYTESLPTNRGAQFTRSLSEMVTKKKSA